MNPVDDHRDPEVDAAWQAASREEPPASLDAALAAAARRAAGARPMRVHTSRAWWPMAAAAVVAVVAIGIVEMTPPEQVAPATTPTSPPSLPVQPAAEQDKGPGQLAAPPDTLRDQPAPAPAAVAPAPTRAAEPTRKVERASPPAKQSTPGASEATRGMAANPFPASPSETTDATVSPADRAAEAPVRLKSRQQAAPPADAGANALQAPASAAKDSREAAPAAAAGALAPRSDESKPLNAPLAKRAQAPSPTLDETAQRSIDDWIALIRRLKAEGKSDLAAKELAAFHARYRERADALLPADLRDREVERKMPEQR